MPSLYIIGGANGSGKTTVSMSLLPNFLDCFEYVNADAIAAGLSPLNPDSMAIEAGRLMITRLRTLSNSGSDFAFETTLAARTFAPFIIECKAKGYIINLISLYLPLCDGWMIYDSSSSSPVFVAERITNQQPIIYVNETWNRITEVEND